MINKFVADFETTTGENVKKEGVTRVWGWGQTQIGDTSEYVKIGTSIDGYMEYVSLMSKNPTIYFHNLGFDATFIFDWLLNNGWEYSDIPKAKTFSVVLDENNTLYTVTMVYKRYRKSIKKVTFYDSFKKLPFTVERIAKAYQLPIAKGSIDYDKYRPIGYKMDSNEKHYIKLDVLVVAKALEFQFNDGLTKMTTGSDALHMYKEILGTQTFKSCFPLIDFETDEYIRRSYKGGFTWVNPKFKNKFLGFGKVYDVNSLYPWVMYEKLLPIGHPKHFTGKYVPDIGYPLYIQRIRVEFEVKPDHIPTIQVKGSRWAKETEYITNTLEVVELVLTNVDLQLFLDHHIVHTIQYIDGYKFQGVQGIFKDYIDPLMKIKENSKGAIRENAKLLLNSLYGKFATNPDVTGKYVAMGEDNIIKYIKKEQEFRDPVYTPMGSFITAYAREKTIRTAMKMIDRFVYADTDSIHILGGQDINIDIHKTHLGAWKHEYDFATARYPRAKMYFDVTIERGQYKNFKTYGYGRYVKGSGIPEEERKKARLIDYTYGFTFYKLKPKKIKGGTILVRELNEVKIT